MHLETAWLDTFCSHALNDPSVISRPFNFTGAGPLPHHKAMCAKRTRCVRVCINSLTHLPGITACFHMTDVRVVQRRHQRLLCQKQILQGFVALAKAGFPVKGAHREFIVRLHHASSSGSALTLFALMIEGTTAPSSAGGSASPAAVAAACLRMPEPAAPEAPAEGAGAGSASSPALSSALSSAACTSRGRRPFIAAISSRSATSSRVARLHRRLWRLFSCNNEVTK